MNHMEDKKIREALMKGTDEAAELKKMVWNNIKAELKLSERKERDMKSKKKNVWSFIKYGSVAAVVTVVIVANTQYGHAAVSRIKEFFAPTKTIDYEIEGMKSEKSLSLKEGTAKYIIYIDEDRYIMQAVAGKDRISTKAKMENLPEVFMEIDQVENKSPEALAGEIQKELKEKYKTVLDAETVKSPVNSIKLYAQGGMNWNDTVVRYYLVDNTKGGSFIIKQQFFLEATEGHGARFDIMLKEFKIVSE